MIPSNSFSQHVPTRDIVNQMAAIVQILLRGGHLGWVEKAMQDGFIVLLQGHLYKTFILKLRWLYFSMSITLFLVLQTRECE